MILIVLLAILAAYVAAEIVFVAILLLAEYIWSRTEAGRKEAADYARFTQPIRPS